MPRIRRRIRARRTWTRNQVEELLTGLGGACGFVDAAAEAAAWRELRPLLLPAWRDRFPGCRPDCWWRLEAPEPRRLTSGPGAWCCRAEADAEDRRRCLWFGAPSWVSTEDVEHPSIYESQTEYLERLSLLTPAERRALASVTAEQLAALAENERELSDIDLVNLALSVDWLEVIGRPAPVTTSAVVVASEATDPE